MSVERGAVALSVVVVAFHRPESLAVLLEQLGTQPFEIVVVNVEANPRVSDVLAAGPADVVEITTQANVGYAAAVNLGTAAARGTVIVFMNDDVAVRAGTVTRLASALATRGSTVTVPAVVDGRGQPEPTIMASPTPGRLLLEWCALPDAPVPALRALPVEKWRRPEQPEPVAAASAIVVCTRRTTLRDHPLPEAYFLYWEEAEWFLQLRRAGHVVTYHPELQVAHCGGRADLRPEKSFLLARNAVLCVRRTQGRAAAVAAWPVVVLWQLRLVVADGARLLRTRDRPGYERVRARVHGLRGALVALRYLR